MIEVRVPEELIDGFPMFIQRRFLDLSTLKDAVKNQDFKSVYEIGHRMKGNGATYGFDILTEVGASLMSSAKSSSLINIQHDIEKFEAALKGYKLV